MKIMLKYCLGLFFVVFFVYPSSAAAYYTSMPASVVVGQTNFTDSTAGATQSKFSGNVQGLFVDPNGRMIIGDDTNNRVLIWNSVPTSNGVPADLVLGQADFTSISADRGGSAEPNTLHSPGNVYSDGNKLFVADRQNRRVLIWNTFPTQNGQAADVVVGQTDMTGQSTTGACAQNRMHNSRGLYVYNNKLIVADENNRVLIWNSIPTTNGANADVVLGQSDFVTCTEASSPLSTNISYPGPIFVDHNGRLYVVDVVYDRVLIWNSIPTTSGQAADLVLGQPDFTTATSGSTTANSLDGPFGVYSDGTRLFVSDYINNRVLVWNALPTQNGQAADLVIGQSNFTSKSTGRTANTLTAPVQNGVTYQNKFLVVDGGSARILIFENVFSSPQLQMNPPTNVANDRIRISGSVKLGERPRYALQRIEASINGEGFGTVTFKDGGRDDGSDATVYDFYHEFDPWAANGTRETWASRGYTVMLKATSYNAEVDQLFYFEPFSLTLVSGVNPTFVFSVNRYQWQRMKDNLEGFEVYTKSPSGEWKLYAEKIALTDTIFDKTTGTVTITPRGKHSFLSGTYEVKIVAKDKWGHRQSSNSVKATVDGLGAAIERDTSREITPEWFPLQINSISGTTALLSSFRQNTKNSFVTSTSNPTFKGVAFAGSTVKIVVYDKKTLKSRTYMVVSTHNGWILRPTLFADSIVAASVSDAEHYSELPLFSLSVR